MELSCLWYGVYFPNLQNCLTYHLQMKLKIHIYILWGKQWQTNPKNLPRMQCTRAIPVAWLGSGSCPNWPKGGILLIIYILVYTHTHIYVIWDLSASQQLQHRLWPHGDPDAIPSKQHIPESQAGCTRKVKQLSDRTRMGEADITQIQVKQ